MPVDVLLVIHIAVLGYWLGAEFVINSEFRFVCRAASMPFEERKRLMEHVMDVDQHVRYALVLQAGLGTVLAALLGYFPGGPTLGWTAGIATLLWLAFVEIVHRLRHGASGGKLALLDRLIRYVLLAALVPGGLAAAFGAFALQGWLAWKLVLFGGVIASGIGIRYYIIQFFGIWRQIEAQGSNSAHERAIRRNYAAGTSMLGLLWLCIAAITLLSILKP